MEQGWYDFSLSYDMDHLMQIFCVRDLTGDGIPELYFQGPGVHEIWSIEDDKIITIDVLTTYIKVLANGAFFYYRPGGAPAHNDYYYEGFSPESKLIPDISFHNYDLDNDGVLDTFWINGEEVTQKEWQETTDFYFSLLNAEPTEQQREIPFLEWASSLGVEIPQAVITENN